jgi:hypothetical protein
MVKVMLVMLGLLMPLVSTPLYALEMLEVNKYTLSEIQNETPVLIEAYFSSEGNSQLENFLTSDFQKCHHFKVESNKKNGQGYQVMKSFGHSDDYIVYGGVIRCMESKDWTINKLINGKFKKARYLGYEVKDEELLTQDELKILNNSRQAQKEWYIKYAPSVLEN